MEGVPTKPVQPSELLLHGGVAEREGREMRNKHVLELRVRIEPHPFDDVSNERLVRVVTKSIVQVGQVEVALKGTVEVCDHAAVGTLEGAVPDQTACPWFRFEVLAQGGGRRALA